MTTLPTAAQIADWCKIATETDGPNVGVARKMAAYTIRQAADACAELLERVDTLEHEAIKANSAEHFAQAERENFARRAHEAEGQVIAAGVNANLLQRAEKAEARVAELEHEAEEEYSKYRAEVLRLNSRMDEAEKEHRLEMGRDRTRSEFAGERVLRTAAEQRAHKLESEAIGNDAKLIQAQARIAALEAERDDVARRLIIMSTDEFAAWARENDR